MNFHKFFEGDWAKNYLVNFLTVLTILFIISVGWNLYQNNRETIERARIEARTIFQHNLAYRRWNSMQGGVYARISKTNKPNPYLVVPNRDLTSTEGIKLTLINPFQMTRQAYNLLKKQYSKVQAIHRTVSLDPLNPENEPDDWERNGLLALEQGRHEISEVTKIDGRPYMRLMMPYVTEKPCLKCHGWQGYDVGDIRGAMSVSVPMAPYFEAAASTRGIIIISHLLLWLLGVGTVILFSSGLRKYQKAIIESEKKFRIVSEFAYNFEFWRQEDKIIFISPSCKRITGYSPEEFTARPELLSDIIHPDDREVFKKHLTDFKAPTSSDFEFRIITKDGEERWLSHTCSPIHLEGEFLGRRGSNKDITDKKRLENQLMHAQKMECLGQFAGGIAHDFNNTLSSITTFSSLLKDEVRNCGKEAEDYIKYILIAAKLGKNLTSDLLSFGRKQITNPVPVKLNKIIINIYDMIKTLTSEDIDLNVSLAEEEYFVLVDAHQIEQLLINLCTNARDAISDGGKIDISTKKVTLDKGYKGNIVNAPPGNYMLLSVADTGTGIAKDDLYNIFEPFFTTKQKGKGTGLGLAIVNNIVKQNNAFIDVDSTKNKGTVFNVLIPALQEEQRAETLLTAESKSINGSDNKTILLVEDDELVQKSISLLLRHKGCNVLTAEDGEAAVKKFSRHMDTIDLVILDVVLPQKNGKEVYDIIKRQKKDIKVLFISGYPDDIITAKGCHEEGLEFMSKPLDMDEFTRKIESMTHRET